MKNQLFKYLVALFIVSVFYNPSVLADSFDLANPPGQMVDVGGYQLHVNIQGTEGPTVVLEAGLGDSSLIWSKVQPEIAKFAQVCSYDRAGYGWSDRGSRPRTVEKMVNELHTLLQNAGLKPPYILVGHSMGGLIIRVYESMYPEEVLGMVFVDATAADIYQNSLVSVVNWYMGSMTKLIGATNWLGSAKWLVKMNGPKMFINPGKLEPEVEALFVEACLQTKSLYAVGDECFLINKLAKTADRAQNHLTDKPLITLMSGESFSAGEAAVEQYKTAYHHLSTKNEFIVAEKSGHHIQLDEPELVIDSVRKLLISIPPEV